MPNSMLLKPAVVVDVSVFSATGNIRPPTLDRSLWDKTATQGSVATHFQTSTLVGGVNAQQNKYKSKKKIFFSYIYPRALHSALCCLSQ